MKQLQLDLCDQGWCTWIIYTKVRIPGPFQQAESAGSRFLPGRHRYMPSLEVSPTVCDAKFAITILHVYLPPQEVCVPLRLRS